MNEWLNRVRQLLVLLTEPRDANTHGLSDMHLALHVFHLRRQVPGMTLFIKNARELLTTCSVSQ